MAVDTKKVAGRRIVSYQSYDELLADAESLAGQETKVVGNWTFPQILEHLGIQLEGSIDGIPLKAPFLLRTVAKLFLKNKLLRGGLDPGFQIPDNAKPTLYPQEEKTLEEGLAHLRRGVERCKSESTRADHPLLDTVTREEWDLWNLRHAEMHMSFVKPADG